MPEFKQDIQKILYDGASRIWVATSRQQDTRRLFHIYDEQGNLREQIWLPLPDRWLLYRLQIYGDQCWWLGRNAMEESVLFRARIIKPSA